MEFGFKVTTNGRAIIAACMGLEAPLRLTRVAVGSGLVDKDVNLADMHELIHYVSDGCIGDRRHEDNRLHLEIQFTNDADHAAAGTFQFTEFIIYATNPVTGEDQDFIYATLGDYRQFVPAYSPGYPVGTWSFPVTTVISDEIEVSVSAPAGLVTYSDLIRLLNTRAAGAAKKDIVIPAAGWRADTDTNGTYPYYVDIASMDITEDMIPMLTVHPGSMNTATECGLCPVIRTIPGLLRLYAKSIPSAIMDASLTLLDTVPQNSGLSSSAATARMDIIIPENGWIEDTDEGDAYAVHADIINIAVRPELVPMLTIFPEHLELAKNCGLSPYTRTMPDTLRVYAQKAPGAPISASLALLGVTQSITGNITGEGGDAYALPVATETQLGMIKLGEGLSGTSDGTVSVKQNNADDEDVEDMLGEVYPPNN